jgi:hypothetical protein
MSTSRLVLRRLSLHSTTAPVAEVAFSDGVNVISGPSDTGKSFIVSAIDYMLGSSDLQSVDELPAYNRMLLQLDLLNGDGSQSLTLSRDLKGGRIDLHEGSINSPSDSEAIQSLSPKASGKSANNLSSFLLESLGLTNVLLRTSKLNAARSLSFRDLAHVSIIDETRMQSRQTPIYTSGMPTQRTVERSLFKFLLDGSDDSGLTEIPPPKEVKALEGVRSELLDRVVAVLGSDLPGMDPDQLSAQLARLTSAIDRYDEDMSEAVDARDGVAAERIDVRQNIQRSQGELASLRETYNRFVLLAQQYDSDLERLEMIREGGTLLTWANHDVCVLCGAAPEHQDWSNHQASEVVSLAEAVDAEVEKTRQLAADLAETIRSTRVRARAIRDEITQARERSGTLTGQLAALDAGLKPRRAGLGRMIAERSKLEQMLLTHRQVRAVERIRAEFVDEAGESAPQSMPFPSAAMLDDYCAIVRSTLLAWRVRGATAVRIDETSADLVVGGRPRSGRGKGVRALQHAAFTVGLLRFCANHQRSFPGFAVIDSPLVTYREPDEDPVFDEEAPSKSTVAELFYSNLLSSSDFQIIVMENVDPPTELIPSLNWIEFTANEMTGRYGLFPIVKSGYSK